MDQIKIKMARTLKIKINGKTWEPSIKALTREKVYGFIDELVYDHKSEVCIEGSILDDGQTLIGKGCIALKTVDLQGAEVVKSELVAVDAQGKTVKEFLSVFETGIELSGGTMDDLFDLEVQAAYDFDWADEGHKSSFMQEIKGRVFSFQFNYRTDYEAADAVLLANGEGVFILTGRFVRFDYLDNRLQSIITIPENISEQDDAMDFAMF